MLFCISVCFVQAIWCQKSTQNRASTLSRQPFLVVLFGFSGIIPDSNQFKLGIIKLANRKIWATLFIFQSQEEEYVFRLTFLAWMDSVNEWQQWTKRSRWNNILARVFFISARVASNSVRSDVICIWVGSKKICQFQHEKNFRTHTLTPMWLWLTRVHFYWR